MKTPRRLLRKRNHFHLASRVRERARPRGASAFVICVQYLLLRAPPQDWYLLGRCCLRLRQVYDMSLYISDRPCTVTRIQACARHPGRRAGLSLNSMVLVSRLFAPMCTKDAHAVAHLAPTTCNMCRCVACNLWHPIPSAFGSLLAGRN